MPRLRAAQFGLTPRIFRIPGAKRLNLDASVSVRIFQFPFLHASNDQRLICHRLRWGNRPVARGELAESVAALQADDETRSAGAASSI